MGSSGRKHNFEPLTMFFVFCFACVASVTSLVIPSSPEASLVNSLSVNITEPDPNCPMVGLDCLFNDIERAYNSQTWQECATQCSNHRTCAYWSWRVPSADVNPYGCWLKSGCPITFPDTRLISGAYTCNQRQDTGNL